MAAARVPCRSTRASSKSELERLSRAYVQAFARIIGPDRDIPAPDVYTNAMIMGWMADEYSQIVGGVTPAVITGKPISLGGSLGRNDATARGGYYLVQHLAGELGLSGAMRIAIQGFGNAGQFYASLAAADGHRIVAASDSSGAIRKTDGLDVAAMIAGKGEGRPLVSLASGLGAEVIPPAELPATDCDLLVPAAPEDMIPEGNAASIKARVRPELANGPVTPDGDRIPESNGIVVLPDISPMPAASRSRISVGAEPAGLLLGSRGDPCPSPAHHRAGRTGDLEHLHGAWRQHAHRRLRPRPLAPCHRDRSARHPAVLHELNLGEHPALGREHLR